MFSSLILVAVALAAQPDAGAFKPVDLAPPVRLTGVWKDENGELIGKANAGQTAWFPLSREYWDFDLEGEFMTSSPANGGVAFRANWLPTSPADAPGSRVMYGYQANIDTRDAVHTGEILRADAGTLLSAATKDAAGTAKPGAWNKISIHAAGQVVLVRINDVPAATVYGDAFIGGMLALRADGSEVRFRNLRVRDLGHGPKWRSLFDGKSLAGWKIWGTEDFHVKDGLIECRRGPKESEGYLATEESFTDFRVRGKFKMLGDGNYGLFYHSTITLREKDGYPVIAGVQGEVEPSFPGSTGWVYESYRRGWLIKPEKTVPAASLLRVGEWNEIEIRSQGNHITTWVNGMRVIDWLDPSPQLFSGSFALQLHTGAGAGIDWKDLYVTEP